MFRFLIFHDQPKRNDDVKEYYYWWKNFTFTKHYQGHYVNRHSQGDEAHCHCQSRSQLRSFFTLPKSSRTKEHYGRRLVGYTMDQMFEVVSDVEKYYQFVPWCKESIVLYNSPDNLKAKLIVGFPPIHESYISNISLVKPLWVKAECKDGKLFHHLLTVWRFSPGLKKEPKSCVVDFQITFEFRSAFHSHFSNLFFEQVAKKMENAFLNEVTKRNGPASMPPINLLKDNQALS